MLPRFRRSGVAVLQRFAVVGVAATLLASSGALRASGQGVVITGIVHSRAGAPLSDARVQIVRGRVEAFTGPTGVFRLQVGAALIAAERSDTLRVEHLGFAKRALPITLRDGELQVDVEMTEVALQLDDIVVTGTAGTQTRRVQAGVVATVSVAELRDVVPLATVPDALQGRVTSLDFTPSSGSSGEAQRMWLRGGTSIALSNEPLVFIDGVRADSRLQGYEGGQASSRLFDIDPADVERVEIVKGPAASAIYGTDASAGVIQIFTRRGAVGGRQHFSQRVEFGSGTINPLWKPPTNYARCDATDVQPTSPALGCRGLPAGGVVTDDPIGRAGLVHNGSNSDMRWSAEGGGSNFGVYAAVNSATESGTLPQNSFDRRGARFNSHWAPTEFLIFDAGFGVVRTRTALPQNGDYELGLLPAGLWGDPRTVGTRTDGAFKMPVGALATVAEVNNVTRATPTLRIAHDPSPRLHQRLTVGMDASNNTDATFVPLRYDSAFTGLWAQGVVGVSHTSYEVYTLDYLGTVSLFDNARWGLAMNASAGAQYVETSTESVTAVGWGLVSNYAHRVSDAANRTSHEGSLRTRSLGMFGQTELAYRDRAFLQVATRADRHSAFGARAGPQFFPKFGVSFVVADGERFRTSLPMLQTLRLRAAYGMSGRAPAQGDAGVTYRASQVMLGPGTVGAGLAPASPGNPELRPERGSELEAGADIGLLRDQLSLELTYFDKRTRDLLFAIPQRPSLGFALDPLGNLGAIRNQGLESTLRWRGDLGSRHIETNVGFSTLKNELTDLGIIAPFSGWTSDRFQRGRPLGAFFDYRVIRIDTAASQVIVTDSTEFVGGSMPARMAALGTTLDIWSGLRLHFDLDGKWGYWQHNVEVDLRDRYFGNSERRVRAGEMTAEERLRRFGPFVTEAGLPVSATAVRGPYLQDASFVRWRELSLTWDVPRAAFAWARGSGASVTFAGRNLKLWTRYEGDPEVVSFISENEKGGAAQYSQPTYVTMPQARRWLTRVSVRF